MSYVSNTDFQQVIIESSWSGDIKVLGVSGLTLAPVQGCANMYGGCDSMECGPITYTSLKHIKQTMAYTNACVVLQS